MKEEKRRRRHTRDIGEDGVSRVVKGKPSFKVLTIDLVGLLAFGQERGDGGCIVKPDIRQANANTVLCHLKVAKYCDARRAGANSQVICEGARLWEKTREAAFGHNRRFLT